MEKLKAKLRTEQVMERSRVAGIASALASAHTFLGSANAVNDELDRYQAITAEDIRQAARTYFVPGNRVVLHYLPKSQQDQ